MKKLSIFTILLSMGISSFSQQTTEANTIPTVDYLKKSKNQKKAANILLVGGGTIILTALIIPKGELVQEGLLPGIPGFDDQYENDDIKGALGLVGTLSALGSIPLYIASGKNKRKAATMSLNMERALQISNGNLVKTYFPAFNVKINL